MTIVIGLDQHREQITYDLLNTETGEVRRGRIRPADRVGVRRFLKGLAGERVEAAGRPRAPPEPITRPRPRPTEQDIDRARRSRPATNHSAQTLHLR